MRVCIHPLSYRKRPPHILSRHTIFSDVFDPMQAKQICASEAEMEKLKKETD